VASYVSPFLTQGTLLRHFALVRPIGDAQPARQRWQGSIVSFIRDHAWRSDATALTSCTWLELLIVFELHTGMRVVSGHDLETHGRRLAARATVHDFVASFKKAFMQVVSSPVHPDERGFFVAARGAAGRLRVLGFCGYQAGVAAVPVLDRGMAERVARALLSLRAALPGAWVDLLAGGELVLRRAPLCLRVRPSWRPRTASAAAQVQGAAGPVAFSVLCPARCGNTLVLPERPGRDGTGYQKGFCSVCKELLRLGAAVHTVRMRRVAQCSCAAGPVAAARGRGAPVARGDIRAFFH